MKTRQRSRWFDTQAYWKQQHFCLSFGVQFSVRLGEAYYNHVLQSQRISAIINGSFLVLRIIPTVETYLRVIDVEKVSHAF